MRKTLVIASLSFIALGLFLTALPALRGGEKATAIFFLGHWFDIFWELAVPFLSLGVLLCGSVSLWLFILGHRGAEAQSSEAAEQSLGL